MPDLEGGALGEGYDRCVTLWPAVAPAIAPAALLARVEKLRREADLPVTDQHVVSRVLLKQFSELNTDGGHEILACNLQFCRGARRYGLKQCGKIKNWMPVASHSIESLWSRLETHYPRAIEAVENGTVFQDGESQDTIKRIMALHYVRSPHLRNAASVAVAESRKTLKENWLRTRRAFLVEYYTELNGISPTTDCDIASACDQLIDKINTLDVELVFRVKAEENFNRIQEVLSTARLQIVTPPRGREFLISDAPACSTRDGTSRIGLQEGIGLYSATQFSMPLSPRFSASLSPALTPGYQELSGRRSDRLNTNQIRNAYTYIYGRPGSGLIEFIERNLKAWRKPPRIRPLGESALPP